MTQREKHREPRHAQLLNYLQQHKSISVKDANSILGMNKNAFWSAVRQLRDRGYYITAYRGTRHSDSHCLLQTKEEWECDNFYSKANHPKLWTVWKSMRDRCENAQHKSYSQYGGRGIKICEEWKDHFQSFAKWACENGYDENACYMECTLDRIDNNGNYEPNNCRWVDMKTQCNNRRNNLHLTLGKESKTLSQWSDALHIPVGTLHGRLKNGWSVERTLTTPVRRRSDNAPGVWLADC